MTTTTVPMEKAGRESELRCQLLEDERLGALIGTMHHALGYSPKEIQSLIGGLTTRLIGWYLKEFSDHHADLLSVPAGNLAAELHRRLAKSQARKGATAHADA